VSNLKLLTYYGFALKDNPHNNTRCTAARGAHCESPAGHADYEALRRAQARARAALNGLDFCLPVTSSMARENEWEEGRCAPLSPLGLASTTGGTAGAGTVYGAAKSTASAAAATATITKAAADAAVNEDAASMRPASKGEGARLEEWADTVVHINTYIDEELKLRAVGYADADYASAD